LTKCFSVTHLAAIEFNTGSVHACSGRNNTQNPVNERYRDITPSARSLLPLPHVQFWETENSGRPDRRDFRDDRHAVLLNRIFSGFL
jgi:hypothetical protein